LHGLAVDMDRVMAIARQHNLKVIEDCCQAHGALFGGRKVGTWGDCAAFSFNQNKCLCSGEGGAFVTDDEDLNQAARQLWSFGETRTPAEARDYHAYALGWMYRNNDPTAAFARSQLTKLDGYLEKIKANAAVFTAALQGVPHLILPTAPEGCEPNWYNYTLRFDMEALGHAHDAAAISPVRPVARPRATPLGR
jgi:dTDP-4-amino-4,6-dideoxygalactose transaminase